MTFVYLGLGILLFAGFVLLAGGFMNRDRREYFIGSAIPIALVGGIIALSAWASVAWGGEEGPPIPNKIDQCNAEGKVWYQKNAGKSSAQDAQCLTKEQVDIMMGQE